MFDLIDMHSPEERKEVVAITREYFEWMNGEILRVCSFSIPELVGMSIDEYVEYTADIASDIAPEDGGIYGRRSPSGAIMAMGGLRRLPDGAAEIVRIFTRPEFRGQGLGFEVVGHLVDVARQRGYGILRLDTAVFMSSAQKIYGAAGFTRREPYEGAEPPPRLRPFWLFMERAL